MKFNITHSVHLVMVQASRSVRGSDLKWSWEYNSINWAVVYSGGDNLYTIFFLKRELDIFGVKECDGVAT